MIISIPMTVRMFQGSTVKAQIDMLEQKNVDLETQIKNDIDRRERIAEKYDERIRNTRMGRYDALLKENPDILPRVKKLEEQKSELLQSISDQIKLNREKISGNYSNISKFKEADPSLVQLSFPEQFMTVITQAKSTDYLLHLLIFSIIASIDISPIITKMVILKRDSYDEFLESCESKKQAEFFLDIHRNTNEMKVFSNIFDTNNNESHFTKEIERIQKESQEYFLRQLSPILKQEKDAMIEKLYNKAQNSNFDNFRKKARDAAKKYSPPQ